MNSILRRTDKAVHPYLSHLPTSFAMPHSYPTGVLRRRLPRTPSCWGFTSGGVLTPALLSEACTTWSFLLPSSPLPHLPSVQPQSPQRRVPCMGCNSALLRVLFPKTSINSGKTHYTKGPIQANILNFLIFLVEFNLLFPHILITPGTAQRNRW